MTAPPTLQTRELGKRYGEVWAARGVSLTVAAGETLALLGPSGCGKSTALHLIAGLLAPDAGAVWLRGQPAPPGPEARRVGLVFQSYALFPHLSVLGNVAYGPRARRAGKREAERRAGEALARVGLSGFESRRPGTLSGGQQQRVALARALATETDLLLLDEPLSNLDERLRAELRAELGTLLRALDTATVIVTHDHREALALADTVAVMRAGRVVQQGQAAAVFAAPETAWVAEFLGWANLLPAEDGRVRLVPEGAAVLGAGEPCAVLERARGSAGERVTVAHPLGPLRLLLSPREAAQHLGGDTLRLGLREDALLTVPDDRETAAP